MTRREESSLGLSKESVLAVSSMGLPRPEVEDAVHPGEVHVHSNLRPGWHATSLESL